MDFSETAIKRAQNATLTLALSGTVLNGLGPLKNKIQLNFNVANKFITYIVIETPHLSYCNWITVLRHKCLENIAVLKMNFNLRFIFWRK